MEWGMLGLRLLGPSLGWEKLTKDKIDARPGQDKSPSPKR